MWKLLELLGSSTRQADHVVGAVFPTARRGQGQPPVPEVARRSRCKGVQVLETTHLCVARHKEYESNKDVHHSLTCCKDMA